MKLREKIALGAMVATPFASIGGALIYEKIHHDAVDAEWCQQIKQAQARSIARFGLNATIQTDNYARQSPSNPELNGDGQMVPGSDPCHGHDFISEQPGEG